MRIASWGSCRRGAIATALPMMMVASLGAVSGGCGNSTSETMFPDPARGTGGTGGATATGGTGGATGGTGPDRHRRHHGAGHRRLHGTGHRRHRDRRPAAPGTGGTGRRARAARRRRGPAARGPGHGRHRHAGHGRQRRGDGRQRPVGRRVSGLGPTPSRSPWTSPGPAPPRRRPGWARSSSGTRPPSSPSGDALSGMLQGCGTVLPETALTGLGRIAAGGDKILIEVPDDTWEKPAMPKFPVTGMQARRRHGARSTCRGRSCWAP